MFSKYFSGLQGADVISVLGLVIFFTLFIGVIIRLVLMDKKYVTHMENLPLDAETNIEIKDKE